MKIGLFPKKIVLLAFCLLKKPKVREVLLFFPPPKMSKVITRPLFVVSRRNFNSSEIKYLSDFPENYSVLGSIFSLWRRSHINFISYTFRKCQNHSSSIYCIRGRNIFWVLGIIVRPTLKKPKTD